MRTRYVVGLVVLTLVVAFFSIKFLVAQFPSVKDIVDGMLNPIKNTVETVKNVGRAAVDIPAKVADKLKGGTSDPKLSAQVNELQTSKTVSANDTDVLTRDALGTFVTEKDQKIKIGAATINTMLENVKQEQLNRQKAASAKYAEIINKVELEKAKATLATAAAQKEKMLASQYRSA
jgi:hypothetical protein